MVALYRYDDYCFYFDLVVSAKKKNQKSFESIVVLLHRLFRFDFRVNYISVIVVDKKI